MNRSKCIAGVTALAVLITGCATPPMGPMVYVPPGPGKSQEAFQSDDMACRGYAQQMTAGQAEAANNRAVGAGVLGTVLGAGLGAAVGGGRGAAIGAGSGAIAGSAIGANQSQYAQGGIQLQYDNAYRQCMASRGNGGGNYGPPPGYGPPPPPPPPGY
jgi:outer membrane lipoprotein SlyB